MATKAVPEGTMVALGLVYGAAAGTTIGVAVAGGTGLALGAAMGAGLGIVIGAIIEQWTSARSGIKPKS